MEQAINRYQSPYRANFKRIEVDKKAIKYWGKFVKQTIISAGILSLVMACEHVEVIANSEIWNRVTGVAKTDFDIEQVKNGIEWGIEYAKVAVPDMFEMNNNEKNEEISPEVEENIITQESIDITEGMTQEEKDVYNIIKATTVLRPLNGEITSKFGDRIDPITKKYALHTGTDFSALVGTQVKAAISGTVIEVKNSNESLGKYVRVKNADIVTTYGHCSEIKVAVGDKVRQGDVIALSGNTGKSSGPHLHFEVIKGGRYVDPEKVIYTQVES